MWKTNWIGGVDVGHDLLHNALANRLNRITHICDAGVTFQSAIDAGGLVFVPDGTHTLTAPLTLKSNIRLLFESRASILKNDTGDVFTGGGVNIEIAGGTIQASAGHVFAPTEHFSHSYIHDCVLAVTNTAKSVFSMDNAALEKDYIGNVVERCILQATTNHTVPTWYHRASGNVNANVWRDCEGFCSGNYVFWIENSNPMNFAYDNRFENIIFEVTIGGSIKLLGCNHAVIDNCHEYDFHAVGAAQRDLIYLGASGRECWNCAINSSGRRGGELREGIYDINLAHALRTKIDTCGATADFTYRTAEGANTTGTVWINDTERGTVFPT